MTPQASIFLGERAEMTDSASGSIHAMIPYAASHPHWVSAWSMGKDSTTVTTFTVSAMERGLIPRPKSLTVLCADTRMELLPLWHAAADVRRDLEARGVDVRVVMAPIDKRFLVYMLRGLEGVLKFHQWRYLTPLRQLRPLWRELRKAKHRIRKDGTERNANGKLSKNPGRWGPIRLESRLWALGEVIRIQTECNQLAGRGQERVDMLNDEEETRIRELIAARTFPDRWEGDEIGADEMIDEVFHLPGGGTVTQHLLPGLLPKRGAALRS